jgi:hypothetical protein
MAQSHANRPRSHRSAFLGRAGRRPVAREEQGGAVSVRDRVSRVVGTMPLGPPDGTDVWVNGSDRTHADAVTAAKRRVSPEWHRADSQLGNAGRFRFAADDRHANADAKSVSGDPCRCRGIRLDGPCCAAFGHGATPGRRGGPRGTCGCSASACRAAQAWAIGDSNCGCRSGASRRRHRGGSVDAGPQCLESGRRPDHRERRAVNGDGGRSRCSDDAGAGHAASGSVARTGASATAVRHHSRRSGRGSKWGRTGCRGGGPWDGGRRRHRATTGSGRRHTGKFRGEVRGRERDQDE